MIIYLDNQILALAIGIPYKALLKLMQVMILLQINKSSNAASVPESLYLQTGLMIQHGILDLEAIYEMLGPEDSVIIDEAEKEMSEAKEFVRKMNIVSTKDKEEGEEKAQDIASENDAKVII